MFDKIPKLTLSALTVAVIGAVVACQSDEPPQSPAAPKMLLQSLPQTSSFVGTVPASRSDEGAITPTETVGAAAH
jgi:hypothetical protein